MESYEELKKRINVLLVDDDIDYVQVTAFFLKSKGYNIEVATSGIEAIDKAKSGNVDIMLLDYYMPEMTGEDVVSKVREFNKQLIIILQTGFAGQQPPEETLARLNIQNYHDKSDGVNKLLLQVMSATRIFEQQSQVTLAEYRTKAIGRMIRGIAEELKSPILSIEAGIEATKVLIEKKNLVLDDKLLQLYENNKKSLNRIDKILTSIIGQSEESSKTTSMTAREVLEILKLMTNNDSMSKGIEVVIDSSIEDNKYIHGSINDALFLSCEIIHLLIQSKDDGRIDIDFKENANAWYITIVSDRITEIEKSKIFIIKTVAKSIKGMSVEEIGSQYIIEMKK